MTDVREHVGKERTHLRIVRQSLSAALADDSDHDEGYLPFFIAIADYFEAAMGRLHAQDIRIGELIEERTDSASADLGHMLSDLGDRLSGSRQHLNAFIDARDSLKTTGVSAFGDFESVGRAYTEYIQSRMGHQGPVSDLAAKLLTADDWVDLACVTDEAVATEQALYDRVLAAIPAELDFTVIE